MAEEFEQQEYFTIVNIVQEFDKHLLTVKGWGVTLSLAALSLGFQYKSYGYFLIAFASSFAFWSIEFVMKKHQMRYYPRMREIELHRYETAADGEKETSAPRIDGGWGQAQAIYLGHKNRISSHIRARGTATFYRRGWLSLHVALPHAITLLFGLILFALGLAGQLPGFSLGAKNP